MRLSLFMVGICFATAWGHAVAAGKSPESPAKLQQTEGDLDRGVFSKLDLSLRRAIGDKTSGEMRAVAELTRPLTPEAIDELQQAGLRLLSAGPNRAYVEGDAHALMRLAARNEVTRLHASRTFKPLPKE